MLPACFILIHSLSKTRAINNFSKEGRKKSHLPPLPATSSTFFCLFHRLRPPLLFLPFPLSAPSLFPFIPAEADYIQVMRFPGRGLLGSRTLGWNSPILALFDAGEIMLFSCCCLLLSHSLISHFRCDISCQMLYRFPSPLSSPSSYFSSLPTPAPRPTPYRGPSSPPPPPPPPPPRPYCGGKRGGARPEKNDGLLHQEESTAFELGDDDIGDENDSTLKNYCNPVPKIEPHPTYKTPGKVGRSWHT